MPYSWVCIPQAASPQEGLEEAATPARQVLLHAAVGAAPVDPQEAARAASTLAARCCHLEVVLGDGDGYGKREMLCQSDKVLMMHSLSLHGGECYDHDARP